MIAGTNNQIADVLSCFQTAGTAGGTSTRYHPCMANPVLDRLFHEYQSLGVAPSTCRTFQAGVRSYQQFGNQFNIPELLATPFTLRYFLYCSMSVPQNNQSLSCWDKIRTHRKGPS